MSIKKPDQSTKGASTLRVIGEEALQRGSYSNLVIINHTEEEFILDFLMNHLGNAHLVSRIILSPPHAERLSKALSANINTHKEVLAKKGDAKASSPSRKRSDGNGSAKQSKKRPR